MRFKKTLYLVLLLFTLIGAGIVFHFEIMAHFLIPTVPFRALNKTTTPNYSKTSSWLALPETNDKADVLGLGEVDRQQEAQVDVFFIHPTTYFGNAHWNDPLDGSGEKVIRKSSTLLMNASVFNECCRIYAPIYRQAGMGSFMDGRNLFEPVNFAFQDVLAAFDYYMEHYNQGRPIILAGHSQGSDQGLHLLKRRFSQQELRKKLVAAYFPGRPIGTEFLSELMPDIPVCAKPDQIGCFVSWMTMGTTENLSHFRDFAIKITALGEEPYSSLNSVCVNPLDWSTDGSLVGAENSAGLYLFDHELNQVVSKNRKVSAQCEAGVLLIAPTFYSLLTGFTNYHVFDYALFYKSIRANAKLRSEVYLQKYQ